MPIYLIDRLIILKRSTVLFLIYSIIIVYTIYIIKYLKQHNNYIDWHNFIIINGVLVTVILFFVMASLVFSTSIIMNNRKRNLYPDALFIHILMLILLNLQWGDKYWNELKFKKSIISYLEDSAKLIQFHLSRQLTSGDSYIDLWASQTTTRIAFALRNLKKWIITPKLDTREYFIMKIVDIFTNAVLGNWDAIEQQSLEMVYTPSPLIYRIGAFFHTLFIALTPALIFIFVQLTPLKLNSSIKEYIILGTIIWACLTIIAALDPLFSEKISAIKDITKYFPGMTKNKEYK